MTAHPFVCVVCKDDKPEEEARKDEQQGGDVCAECHRNLLWGAAWLKKAGIRRSIDPKDINQSNFHRFQSGYNL